MGAYDTIVENNRICYVDPNDIRGNIDGAPLTPDYTDFSIWCNLIVERSSRLKNQASGSDAGEKFMVSFDLTKGHTGTEFVSFLQGKDADDYNFLTTDYTNIDYSTIKERNIIEGLQIETVNISFTNYQTPQVTIKFVDIRGGGFFGREEATHSEFGGLSSLEEKNNQMFDNFYSCFVSFPYPRFRLQVKGFYGKPVTYQLTCTNFSGNLNSQTGNFEITVQFIGYEYGILGDIPFDLLVAAPMTPAGSEYWDEHVKNMATNGWALDREKTEPPIKLYDFYNNVSKQLQNSTPEALDASITEDTKTQEKLTGLLKQIDKLNEIKESIQTFKTAIKEIFKQHYITECVNDDENVVIIHNPTEVFTKGELLTDLCDKRNNIGDLIEEYNKQYTAISLSVIPNNNLGNTWARWTPNPELIFNEFINHVGDETNKNQAYHQNVIVAINSSNRVKNETVTGPASFVGFKLLKLYSNEYYTITDGVSSKLYNTMTLNNWAIFGKDNSQNIAYAKYAAVIDLSNTKYEIDKRLSNLYYIQKMYEKRMNSINGNSIRNIVGFTPYVGRYFKVVMCHLETFVQLFYNCADAINEEILNNLREPEKLGIYNLSIETDVPGNIYKQVPPFPAVYRKYSTVDGDDTEGVNDDDEVKSNAWIGEFKGETEWQEKKLVSDFYLAAQRIKESRKEKEIDVGPIANTNYKSLLPIDYFVAIPQYAYASLDGLKFYSAIRAFINLHLMGGGKKYITNGESDHKKNQRDCRLLGMYNAYIYLMQKPKTVSLKDLIGGEKLTNRGIYDSVLYTDAFKEHKPFEYEQSCFYENRNPFLVEVEGKSKAICNFMPGKYAVIEYIPLQSLPALGGPKARTFKAFFKSEGETSEFELVDPNDDKFLYTGGKNEPIHENTHHFEIITNDNTVTSIKQTFQNYRNGGFEICGKKSSEFADALEAHLHLDDERYNKFYQFTGINAYKDTYKQMFGKDVNTFIKANSFDVIKNKFLELDT